MSTVETGQSKLDIAKLAVAGLLLAGGVAGFYYFAEEYFLPYRVLALLAVIAITIVIAYNTAAGKSMWIYTLDARAELRKVVWPTRAETMQTTLVVSVVVVVVGVLLWLLDIGFGWAIRGLLSL
ncbi:MAG TPA: preprotein translocase subunit SecE [Gammaproteobacteria bacterium]